MRLWLLAALLPAALHAQSAKVVKAAHVLDVRTGRWVDDGAVLIRGDRIEKVGPAREIAVPGQAKVIDLGPLYLLPGLIDVHIHINDEPRLRGGEYHTASTGRLTILGVRNARITLEAGFTSARSLGSAHYSDVAVRDGINLGEIPGPRLQVSGPMVGGTGTHCDYTFLAPEFRYNDEGIADGVPGLLSKVREGFKYGGDLVKFCASGGVSGRGNPPDDVHLSQEEMTAIVAEAHRRKRPATAHAHGAEAIKMAVRAGVESIEHGSLLDDEAIQLMKVRGTVLVPTISGTDWIQAHGAENNFTPGSIARSKFLQPIAQASFQRAVAAGVKIAFGSDAGTIPHGIQAGQFVAMVSGGLTPLQALQSATIGAADLMGWSNRVGAIEAGKFADLIAVTADPTTTMATLTDVRFVMKGGEVFLRR